MKNVLKEQVGGTHYLNQSYQVIQFLQDTQLNTALGYAVKYIARYPNKNPDDLKKAIHCLKLFKHWFNEKAKKEGLSNYIPKRLSLSTVITFTHQFEPEKCKLLQEVINLNNFNSYLPCSLEDLNNNIDYVIESVKAYLEQTYS